jgi:nitroreductase
MIYTQDGLGISRRTEGKMDFRKLVEKSRSIRRFDQSAEIPEKALYNLVDLARITPSATNMQPLKYKIVFEKEKAEKVFSTLRWAAALRDWQGPEEGERPAAYIVILLDTLIFQRAWVDPGITAVTIQYGATEMGYGACILGSINKEMLCDSLAISDRFAVQLVVALGVPKEDVVLEDMGDAAQDFNYYRTGNGIHHVPKRRLSDIII